MRSTERGSSRAISKALVDACDGTEGNLTLGPAATERLVAAARFHRVAPLVLVCYRSSGRKELDVLQDDRRRAIVHHLRACHALDQLAAVLRRIEWVTFKGPVFSELAHPSPGLRTYNDVDVLVAPSSLREVCGRLQLAGWHVADFRDMLRNPQPPGEMHWVSPDGVLLDLHWSMINMHSRRRRFEVPTARLLDRRRPVTLGGTQVWTLDPCDSLVHACLHAALAGANKLVFLIDVDRLSQTVTDWDEVALRAKQWRAQVQVALVLGRARRVLSTSLPADLDYRLGVARPIGALLALTDLVAPVPRGRENTGVAKFVARAVRTGTADTVRAAGANAVQGVLERVRRNAVVADDRLRADGPSLEAYLAAVESTAGPVV